MPDAMILCHQPLRTMDNYGFPLISIPDAIRLHMEVLRHFRPSPVVGIGMNSVGLNDARSRETAQQIERETGLPTADVLRHGPVRLADAVLKYGSDHEDYFYLISLRSSMNTWNWRRR